ncbi:MAG: methyltransferase domain-containing protein [Atopobiaceae bacterium]|nr:methyltransferase domain-containing protein [Atopobiaceae bacterium]MBR1829914.1 methyltransferase domain-containing protein [Atopobiaceae bacterium]
MHGMHARLPKNFVLEERLETYADAIELRPANLAGRWAEACLSLGSDVPYREVRLDLGCGKGHFSAASAKREPDVLFIGIDAEPICIAYAAQKATEEGLRNMVLVPGTGEQVVDMFGAGEVSRIHLNFPTPYPRKKEAHKRLVILERLLEYRRILAPAGEVALRTDSQPLRDFALTQFELAGYDVTWQSDDARGEHPDDPTSEYEERLSAQGACVYAITARPGKDPGYVEQTAPLSLVDYLPQDLQNLDYVPHGMQGTVINLRNRRIHEAMRARN